MNAQSSTSLYEIRLKGHLGPNTLIWFENFNAEYGPDGETVLRGPVVDQAALHGILARIRDMGMTLIEVKQLPSPPEPNQ